MIEYKIAVTPLTQFWADSEPVPSLREAALENLQEALVDAAGDAGRWDESDKQAHPPASLDVGALYALRATAAWLEIHGNLDEFEPTEKPWEHPVFEAIDNGDESERFPQLIDTEGEIALFVPTPLPEVLLLSAYDEGEDGDQEEDLGEDMAVGSLPTLLAELIAIADVVGVDPRADSETGAVHRAIMALVEAVDAGLAEGLPVVLYAEDSDE